MVGWRTSRSLDKNLENLQIWGMAQLRRLSTWQIASNDNILELIFDIRISNYFSIWKNYGFTVFFQYEGILAVMAPIKLNFWIVFKEWKKSVSLESGDSTRNSNNITSQQELLVYIFFSEKKRSFFIFILSPKWTTDVWKNHFSIMQGRTYLSTKFLSYYDIQFYATTSDTILCYDTTSYMAF